MDSSVISGLFALGGAAIGAIASILATRVDRRWTHAKSQIQQLCDQVSAYHHLEKIYKAEYASALPKGKAEKTVLEEMRTRVEDIPGCVRPTMTDRMAKRIKAEWH